MDDTNYPSQPTCRLFARNKKFLLSNLNPDTNYFLKIVILKKDQEFGSFEIQFRTEKPENGPEARKVERSQSPATNCSSLSTPSSVEDETTTNNVTPCGRGDNYDKTTEPNLSINCSDNMTSNKVNSSSNALQITPQKIEEKVKKNENFCKKKNRRKTGDECENEPQAGSSSKKRKENREGECNNNGIEEKKDFEYYVKVIRRLESDGYIQTAFRQKFLTWYSLRATSREVRVVRVFVDTFLEDPESLAGQLVDAFSDIVSNKKCLSSTRCTAAGAAETDGNDAKDSGAVVAGTWTRAYGTGAAGIDRETAEELRFPTGRSLDGTLVAEVELVAFPAAEVATSPEIEAEVGSDGSPTSGGSELRGVVNQGCGGVARAYRRSSEVPLTSVVRARRNVAGKLAGFYGVRVMMMKGKMEVIVYIE
ncbi:VIN3-like protein 2 [Striga hermonthica]|uniref:VIN3-like protein 2 n=1 Tax=Striga hermonthica TaxID=68872 RepID=A0A9N7RN94_STRHE|nr:VIN3-like protein 2 [Striga hermonthica]